MQHLMVKIVVMKRMKPWKREDSLEGFMRRQEKIIKQNEKYKRLMIIPVMVIAFSVSTLVYNLTAGRWINFHGGQNHIIATAEPEKLPENSRKVKINLNTATAEMLDSLPEIGPKKVDAIIEMRSRMGGFRSVEDILNVDGIGEKTLAQIQHMLYVENQ